jgi:hypothetical protein
MKEGCAPTLLYEKVNAHLFQRRKCVKSIRKGTRFYQFNTPADYQAALHQWQSRCSKTSQARRNSHVLALTYPRVIFSLQGELKIVRKLLFSTPLRARVAELADALDLGSSGQPWGFESPLSHHDS